MQTCFGSEIPESQLRPLTNVPDDAKREIWQQVTATNEKITAKVVQDAVSEWKSKNETSSPNLVCEQKSIEIKTNKTPEDSLASEWGTLILENSSVIIAEQKKTYNAQRKLNELKAKQANLIQQGVEKILTSVEIQIALMNSFLSFEI